MKFKYTILYVENVTKTLDFYVHAFGFKQKMIHESGDYGELETGLTILSFSKMDLMKQQGKNPSKPIDNSPAFEIAFETEDVQYALSNALKAGAKLIQKPEVMSWGQTTAYVTDINGFLIEICTPIIS